MSARAALLFRQQQRTIRAAFSGKEPLMLGWAITFLIIAIIAGILGFGGIAGTSAGIAQILFFIFLVLFVLSLIGRVIRKG